ncbi:MAG: hypothetical protein AAB519_00945 [Patescibacteria group bacterium]
MSDFFLKLKNIPEPVRAFFMADDPRIISEEAALLFGIPLKDIPAITGPLGDVFVKNTPLSMYPDMIIKTSGIDSGKAYGIAFWVNEKIFKQFPEYFTDAEALSKDWESKKSQPLMSEVDAKNKLHDIEPWILEEQKAQAKEVQEVRSAEKPKVGVKKEVLPLLQALSKYQQLGNQMISSERIKIKSQPEPVRGSLFNWIKYYRDELGVGFHDSVQRGNFLFRSENGRKLSEDERERVNIILRSVEEEYPVQIDTTAQEIIFPEREQRSRNAFSSQEIPRQTIPQGASIMRGPAFATPGAQSPSAGNRYESGALHVNHDQPVLPPKKVQVAKKSMGIGGLSFSFNHVLPAEKEKMMSQKQEVSGNPNPQVSSSLVFTDLAPEPPKPRAIPPRPLQSNPFHIRPVSLAQDDQKDR